MPGSRAWLTVVVLVAMWAVPLGAGAQDADQVFTKGKKIASFIAGGGAQSHTPTYDEYSDLSFLNFDPRLGYLPFEAVGPGWLRGSLEVALEAWLQHYLEPDGAGALGIKAGLRYHFVGLGRFVPYLEVTAGVGQTNLKVIEMDSRHTFVLEGGAGLAYLLSENWALSVGYRFQHLSNADTESPNRGINSDSGIVGISFIFD
jgi:opacity protein-like surface antigen